MQEKKDALPADFLERLIRILGEDDARQAVAAMSEPRRTSFRVNTLKADLSLVQELERAGLHPTHLPFLETAFSVPPEERDVLLNSEIYRRNLIYVQSASSMIPALALDPQPSEAILDLTAAPGSKTLQMAAMMNNCGEIAAVEIVRERFYRMNALLREYGAENVRTFLRNGMTVWRHRPDHFDRVLLDAPCSSEGRFEAAEPETYAYWSLRKIREMQRKQRKLLYSAVRSLRPGGVLVYSTCSFAPEENELVLTELLRNFEDVTVEPLGVEVTSMRSALARWEGKSFDPRLGRHARRIVPDGLFEGFFVARLRKRG
ncbi:MAG: RsmB/NOP family class I SAM-dependent RNA methyltransferase [Bacteroidota bacterium]